ncbi:MAG TPA: hypothetical protein VG269_12980 [Tepidisphaeraceae bacterium]|jgi:hypothetical protein|nr:hypothetical protein [Tepidisphaeraceae bacterium]
MKDEVAERLAHAHYRIEPTIRLIRRVLGAPDQEADPTEPIKLLEVNEVTTADGILPVYFGPHAASGVPYPSLIIEITPEEYDEILREPGRLPHGWQIGQPIEREAAAH